MAFPAMTAGFPRVLRQRLVVAGRRGEHHSPQGLLLGDDFLLGAVGKSPCVYTIMCIIAHYIYIYIHVMILVTITIQQYINNNINNNNKAITITHNMKYKYL